jgi:hypothetical protein
VGGGAILLNRLRSGMSAWCSGRQFPLGGLPSPLRHGPGFGPEAFFQEQPPLATFLLHDVGVSALASPGGPPFDRASVPRIARGLERRCACS